MASLRPVFFDLILTFSIVALLMNLLVVVVIARTSKLRIKYYAFVYNLVLADLGFSTLAIVVVCLQDWTNVVVTGLLTIFPIANVLTVLAVAINRYLAISLVPPARYDAVVTPLRLFIVCVLIWGVASACTLPLWIQARGSKQLNFRTISTLIRVSGDIVIWLITAIVYVVVYRKIKRYTPPLAVSSPVDAGTHSELSATRYRQTRRLLVTFSAITAVSLICWIPYDANIFFGFFVNLDPARLTQAQTNFFFFTALLYFLNPLFDPLIYWWRLEGFREALCGCFRKDRLNEVEVGNDNTIAETELDMKATNDAEGGK